MPNASTSFLRRYLPDAVMLFNVIVWGVQFIVMKDAISTLPPLAYNAIRFSVGLPVLLMMGIRQRDKMRIDREDILRLVGLSLIGQFGYQVLSVLALARTTGTNVALLLATVPAWTAILSIIIGALLIRRAMLLGLAMSLVGVSMVILGDAADSVSVEYGDLFGMVLALTAAICISIFTINIKPLMDHYGASVIAIWSYIITCAGLLVVAWPDLRTLGPADVPMRIWPHIAYSGILSSAILLRLRHPAPGPRAWRTITTSSRLPPLSWACWRSTAVTAPIVIGGVSALTASPSFAATPPAPVPLRRARAS